MKNKGIIAYCKENTGLEIQDVFKFLYQSCLGCEHLVSDYSASLERIKSEALSADADDLPEVEYLGGDFCRVHLKMLNKGITPEALCRLFIKSSEPVPGGRERLEKELENLAGLAKNKEIPFPESEISEAIGRWRETGFPPVHHSERFRAAHHPAYRVIKTEFLKTMVSNTEKR